ncbi:MAG: hypothetical protein ACM3SY_03630 [Candidatus Omnitrophota bacterium]
MFIKFIKFIKFTKRIQPLCVMIILVLAVLWLGNLSEASEQTGRGKLGKDVEPGKIKEERAGSCGTPPYAPAYWNDNDVIQSENNCYNYANNKRTDSYAQPGRAGGRMYTSMDCAEVGLGATTDDLEQTSRNSKPRNGKTKIALVVWPGVDFHWYRQDSDGKWSHKPGQSEATNLDDSGKVITDPEMADRGPYTIFCGYFLTCSDVQQGQGHATIN